MKKLILSIILMASSFTFAGDKGGNGPSDDIAFMILPHDLHIKIERSLEKDRCLIRLDESIVFCSNAEAIQPTGVTSSRLYDLCCNKILSETP